MPQQYIHIITFTDHTHTVHKKCYRTAPHARAHLRQLLYAWVNETREAFQDGHIYDERPELHQTINDVMKEIALTITRSPDNSLENAYEGWRMFVEETLQYPVPFTYEIWPIEPPPPPLQRQAVVQLLEALHLRTKPDRRAREFLTQLADDFEDQPPSIDDDLPLIEDDEDDAEEERWTENAYEESAVIWDPENEEYTSA